jgi:CRISPR/Cas system CMR subunit Cmr6 (Cas7 group RAMP superfamily)
MNRIISRQILKNKSDINNYQSLEEIENYHNKLQESIKIIKEEMKRVDKIKNNSESCSNYVTLLNRFILTAIILLIIGAGISWPFAQKWMGY